MDEAIQSKEKGVVKVTMVDGASYIFEELIVKEEGYYGVSTIKGEKKEHLLIKEDVSEVQRRNKKSSVFFNLAGIAIVLGSLFIGKSLFGW